MKKTFFLALSGAAVIAASGAVGQGAAQTPPSATTPVACPEAEPRFEVEPVLARALIRCRLHANLARGFPTPQGQSSDVVSDQARDAVASAPRARIDGAFERAPEASPVPLETEAVGASHGDGVAQAVLEASGLPVRQVPVLVVMRDGAVQLRAEPERLAAAIARQRAIVARAMGGRLPRPHGDMTAEAQAALAAIDLPVSETVAGGRIVTGNVVPGLPQVGTVEGGVAVLPDTAGGDLSLDGLVLDNGPSFATAPNEEAGATPALGPPLPVGRPDR